MSGPTQFNPPFSILDPTKHAPAIGVITTNTRAFTGQGLMAIQSDQILFPLPPPVPGVSQHMGMWTVANRRTFVNGIPTVSSSSTGIGVQYIFQVATKVTGAIVPTIGALRVHTR
ncbi:MAG TPA: hypothetical protein ENJ18_03540 [Nannocystis exedens]|nr:hypothetical protein [Nannocystis exedens]